ncbi:hypothetical protein HDV57DRAFT_281549 [Trichoderma longibrachiatum]
MRLEDVTLLIVKPWADGRSSLPGRKGRMGDTLGTSRRLPGILQRPLPWTRYMGVSLVDLLPFILFLVDRIGSWAAFQDRAVRDIAITTSVPYVESHALPVHGQHSPLPPSSPSDGITRHTLGPSLLPSAGAVANKPFSPSRDNKGQDIKGQSSSPPVLVLIPTEHRTSQILLVPSGGFCSRDTAPFCRFISACVCPDGIFPVPLYIPLFVFVDHIALPTLPILSSAPRFIWLF